MQFRAFLPTNYGAVRFFIRVSVSYRPIFMTGQNLLIEKSKFEMAAEDIASMYNLIMK